MKNILFITVFIFLGACAKNGDDKNTEVAQVPNPTVTHHQQNNNVASDRLPYWYNYQDVNCTTGPQRYPTLAHYCEGLRNERRNNRCAIQSRYNDFRQYCPGHRWQRR